VSAVAAGPTRRYAPLFALLCIDTAERRVRRYVKNDYGRVFVTDEVVMENNPDVVEVLEGFRLNPVR